MRIIFTFCCFVLIWCLRSDAQNRQHFYNPNFNDTSKNKLKKDSILNKLNGNLEKNNAQAAIKPQILDPFQLSLFPSVSLEQYLKGQVAGLYVQEPSGEPGTYQTMFIRGVSTPLLSVRDQLLSQPLVIIDGVPIISNEHPFAYDIQQYDYNRIGPATNLLAGIDFENIASINVIKDISETAIYGPNAANGVIYIQTKKPQAKKLVTFSTYFGLATKDAVTTINGQFESSFEKSFYDRYATAQQSISFPTYLKDSLNSVYFGKSNWTDVYYRNAAVYGADASVSGGSDKASFRFSIGTERNGGTADRTGIDKYSASFVIKMKPTSWLDFTSSVNASKLQRQRNTYIRDILAEVRFLPDLSNPPSPSLSVYNNYLNEYAKSVDDNRVNTVDGFFNFGVKLGRVSLNSQFGVSYNEGYRDLFYPSTILESFNYVSNYYGYSQRIYVNTTATYNYQWNKKGKANKLSFVAGQVVQFDTYRYNYANASGGSNDYIKVNLIDGNLNPVGAYARSSIFKFLDKTANNLASFYGKTTYSHNSDYSVSLLVRSDGSSNAQPTSRWFLSPILSATWDLKNNWLKNVKTLSEFNIKAAYGRIGRIELDDRFAVGPQYTVNIGYTGEPRIPAYGTQPALSRPYTQGDVGYNIPWAYNEQVNLGVNFGLWNGRIRGGLDVYSNTSKNQILGIPSYAEYGYTQSYQSGMDINNSGIDISFAANILPTGSAIKWMSSLNMNINRNKLIKLPGGLTQIVIGDRLLKVGQPTDQYWLLQNEGIYDSDSEIPVNPKTGQKLKYRGVTLQPGDPKWKDVNGDYAIDDNDKTLQGHSLPVISGGFNNQFKYKNWDLAIGFYYNLGRSVVNQEMANRFDFINRGNANDISAVKEITFWEKRGDYDRYPHYNPWSVVIPYQVDQNLFLEDASFLKLRSVSVGYDLSNMIANRMKNSGITRFYIYGTVNNVFTISPYTGRDPELVDYTGYDTGYGLPIPRTYTIGIKMDL